MPESLLDNPYAWYLIVGATTIGIIYFLPKLLPGSQDEKKPTTLRSPYRRHPVGILSTQELSAFTGENGGRILVSICGRIFDMTRGRDFYGPEGPYHAFAGADATYLLGAMSTDPQFRNKRDFGQWDPSWTKQHVPQNQGAKAPYCENSDFSRETLEGWLNSFVVKYPVVGKLRGFMDVCEESWNNLSIEFDLSPGHVTDNTVVVFPPVPSDELRVMSLNSLDQSKHVAIGGYVFDVSICSFVYCRISGDFPGALGHEISVAMVKDDFSEQFLDKPIIPALNESQQTTLDTLVRKFIETFSMVGILTDASKYQTQRQKRQSIDNRLNNQSTLVNEDENISQKEIESEWDVVPNSTRDEQKESVEK